jgi:hypothetical protein
VVPLHPATAQIIPHRLQGGRFTVVAYDSDSLLGASLLRSALERDTFPGLPKPQAKILISIAPDRDTFRQWIGAGAPEWGSAFAFPAERRIVMQGRSAPSDAGDPVRVLRHELAHLALDEALGDLTPRWFDEGYASWAANEWDREAVIAANVGLALGGFRTLASLDSGFQSGSRRAEASYALAYRAVAEMAAIDRQRGLDLLFQYWKAEGSLNVALRQAYGLTYEGFQKRWLDRTRRRYGALALFTDMTLGALVLILLVTPLYLLRRRRDRERLARMRVADAEAERRERESAIEALIRGGDDTSPEAQPPIGGSS